MLTMLTTRRKARIDNILDLDPERDKKCIAYTVSSQGTERCMHRITESKRDDARRLLRSATETLRQRRPVDDLLPCIAQDLLCSAAPRHQDQVPVTVTGWKGRIAAFRDNNPRYRLKTPQRSVVARAMDTMQSGQEQATAPTAPAPAGSPATPASSSTSSSPYSPYSPYSPSTSSSPYSPYPPSTSSSPYLYSPSTSSPYLYSPYAATNAAGAPSLVPGIPHGMASGMPPSMAPTPFQEHSTAVGRIADVALAQMNSFSKPAGLVKPRPIGPDELCGICLLPFSEIVGQYDPDLAASDYHEKTDYDVHNLVWCQASCGTSYHRYCMARWMTGPELDTTRRRSWPTCPTCRRYWVTDSLHYGPTYRVEELSRYFQVR
ncbi:hypothetical protein FE257_004220 [Aspergillus nanangensis]|uniref:RING-type domain-containing protein n=1 Tax=Aspergillus nanangensis TaxID=2582783 RepID=A0AAD4CRH1_ASPNN|nr:hypothetical protein FE257_004220 [Aspergillus nanangensis]